MADIELVIKIPEEDYKRLKQYKKAPFCSFPSRVYEAIANGTPLPEHHGDLKDIGNMELLNVQVHDDYSKGWHNAIEYCVRQLRDRPTIIPATKPPRWIERRLQMGVHDWMCSVCKCQSEDTVRICPNCGADTEGRYEMEENDGGYWFQQREEQTATKEGDGE